MNYKNILKALSIPAVLLIFTLTYRVLWTIFDLPKGQELVPIITKFFSHYGLWVVLLCAILEGALVIGNYFPGGVVIFLSVVVAGRDIPKVITAVAVVAIGFFIGYTIDYFLGKYGWYKLLIKFGMRHQLETAQVKLSRHSLKAIAFNYWEPNLGSITATAAGILQISLKKFLFESAIGLIIWDTFWGVLVASLGQRALDMIFNWTYLIPVVAIWVLVVVLIEYIKTKKVDTGVNNRIL